MFNNICCTGQNLRELFINKLRQALYNKEDFTQGEYIEAIDQVREYFYKDPSIDQREVDDIIKSLTHEWKNIGETIRINNQSKKACQFIAAIVCVTAFVTGIIMWLLFRTKD